MKKHFDPYYSLLLYHSPQRMKYLLSIADDYEFICPAPVICYDPVTYLPAFLIDRFHLEYRADFLMRHRITGLSFLVDLYPLSMVDDARLFLRKRIAESFILWKGFDWHYQIQFEESISLSKNQQTLFSSFSQMNNDDEWKKWLNDYLTMVQLQKTSNFQLPTYSVLDYLYHAIVPNV